MKIKKTKNVKFKTERGLKSKNARKQTHFKIQFYIGIHVTKVEKNIFLKSPCPTDQLNRPGTHLRPNSAAHSSYEKRTYMHKNEQKKHPNSRIISTKMMIG